MSFAVELSSLLPDDLPHRQNVMAQAAAHLDLIVEANQYLNLTRIVGEREAAIKHVVDSVIPWKSFASAKVVADAGTGAGFPGIPLALVLPETRFVLLESIQKKARFVQSVVEKLGLTNVEVHPVRAEEWLQQHKADLLTARAVAPLTRAIPLFAPALRNGMRALLYKGPDAEQEIEEAVAEAQRRRVKAKVALRYELPDAAGIRTLISLAGW
ncbi:16S rRNA (guanine(527)-N(7))-methyltransferase RsmG [Bryobacter aggregatus]|uniref:16S rRNA (guanine(527)-N(7))-methyltransferase RsmG n=1 Tax=Bryobacter aggregatus TaxID=360054 RepID=UPI0004E18664|nr:16S rRNA (guanine(527)-N(7))-methyltransferase RsmG [Bryobacter aggregatus]